MKILIFLGLCAVFALMGLGAVVEVATASAVGVVIGLAFTISEGAAKLRNRVASFFKARVAAVRAFWNARKVLYFHRVVATLAFVFYPVLFVVFAIANHVEDIPSDLRDLRAAFRGDYAF